MSERTLFCLGFGESATLLAQRLHKKGWRIGGSRRTEAGCQARRAAGFNCLPFDGLSRSQSLKTQLEKTTHLLLSAPPLPEGDPLLSLHGADLFRADQLAWIGYLSTTGVYGDKGGAWVDESTAPEPLSERAKRRLDAERAWTGLAEKIRVPLAIFRIAGIYGPGRNRFSALRTGMAQNLVRPGQIFNRIHIADLVSILEASIAQPPRDVRIYNAADDEPAPPDHILAFAAHLLGMETPATIPFEQAKLSAAARDFYRESKRCRNERIKRELDVKLAYPTYRQGLAAILAQENREKRH